MKSLDLFSGIGGMTLKLGFDTTMYCEKDPYARSVLKKRMEEGTIKKAPIHEDVTTLTDIPDIDIITAGFPCQDLSIVGHQKGFEGKKSVLFYEVERIAKLKRPEFIYLENVNHILNMPNVWKIILHRLASLGYDITWTIIGGCNVKIPQRRLRWFLLAKKQRDPVNIPDEFLEWAGKKMYKNGAVLNGKYIQLNNPELEDYKLETPIILEKIKGIKCRGDILQKKVTLWRWATPRANTAIRACRNLTQRSTRDLPSQHRFEKNTVKKYMMSNPTWVEWLMGFPKYWSLPDKASEPYESVSHEPTDVPRMVKDRDNYIKDRCRVLGNACIPQASELAYSILSNRYKNKKLMRKRKRDK